MPRIGTFAGSFGAVDAADAASSALARSNDGRHLGAGSFTVDSGTLGVLLSDTRMPFRTSNVPVGEKLRCSWPLPPRARSGVITRFGPYPRSWLQSHHRAASASSTGTSPAAG